MRTRGKVILWDLATSRARGSFGVSNGTIQSLAISPNGAILAIAGKRVVIWDLNGGREMLQLGSPDDQVNGVAFSHDGKRLAAAGYSGKVRLWDVPGRLTKASLEGHGTTVQSFEGHGTTVQSLAFAPDDRTLVSVDENGFAHLWDTSSGAYDTIMTGQARVWCVAFSSDGRTLVTTSRDATVRLWDMVRESSRGLPSMADPPASSRSHSPPTAIP